MRTVRSIGSGLLGGIGLLSAFQILQQGQLDLEISLTPYELVLYVAFLVAMLLWIWVPLDRGSRALKPIAEDTGEWHFGRNAPIVAIGVVALLLSLAFLSIVLPELDPVIETTISRFVALPLVLVGVVSFAFDRSRNRRQRQLCTTTRGPSDG